MRFHEKIAALSRTLNKYLLTPYFVIPVPCIMDAGVKKKIGQLQALRRLLIYALGNINIRNC